LTDAEGLSLLFAFWPLRLLSAFFWLAAAREAVLFLAEP